MSGNWPLIGRDLELALIADALDHDRATGVVLVGPAGVGKTRLATECLHLAAERGFATTRVVASRAATSIPFGALAPLLPPGAAAVEQGLSALRQVTLALSQHAGGRRLLLVVDDAHCLDDASAVVLEQLAATRAAFLVVTIRAGETPPEPVTALWKDHGLERLTIETLDRPRADRFVTTMLGDDVEQATLGELWDKTEGNPMFLRELVMGAVEAGTLVCIRDRWQSTGELAPSQRLGELVDVRLAGLEPDEVQALELVAFGEPFGFDLLGTLCDVDVVEVLERKGLVALHVDGRRSELRLAHPMYGEVLRMRTPAVRARSINRRLAEAVERTGARRRSDPLRVSQWRLDGGGVPPMPLLLAGAAQAMFALEFATAHRLARTAFDTEATYAAGMLLLQIQYNVNNNDPHNPLFAHLRELASNDRERAAAAVMEATAVFWKFGNAARADRIMAEATSTLEESMERDWLTAFRALVEVQAGNPQVALDLVEPLLQSSSKRTFVRAALSASLALSIVGRSIDAIELAERAFAERTNMGMDITLFEAGLLLVAKAVAQNEIGAIDAALETATFTHLLAADADDLSSAGFCGVALARICLTAGRVSEAAEWAARSIAAFERYGHPGPLRWAYGYLALASALRGEMRDAADALDDLELQPPHPAQMLSVDTERARAWRAVGEGRPEQAKQLLLDAAESMRTTGQIGFEANVLFDVARLGEARAVAARLKEIARDAQGELYPAMSAAADAWVSGDAGDLAAAASRFEAMGAKLFAAELSVAASEAHRRDGDQRRAAEWARRANELVEAIGGARTPALVQVDAPIPLTQREREVAILAAQGLASKVIAERLYVASRTVDNHLARIYAKLGVSSRAELAEMFASDLPVT
jgi:ATP/maltotriose-dependent transcriptional regulator MalT